MSEPSAPSDGRTRLAYILGVPLAPECQRQWPQMGEVVHGSELIARVEGNFPELSLEVGRRLKLDDIVVVEWSPLPRRNGVNHSQIAWTCPQTEPGKAFNTSGTPNSDPERTQLRGNREFNALSILRASAMRSRTFTRRSGGST